jgi:hypothetical protein
MVVLAFGIELVFRMATGRRLRLSR